MRPSRRDLLVALGATGILGLRPARGADPARRLIVVVANGGWDPTLLLDAKRDRGDGPWVDEDPDDPEDREVERAFGEIAVSTNARKRPAVTAFFERWGHRTAVVNGLWTGTLSHWDGMLRVLTGGSDAAAPDLVARVGAALGGSAPLPALDAAGVGRPGPLSGTTGRTGTRGQLAALVSPVVRYPLPDGGPRPDPGLGADDRAAIDRFLAARGLDPARSAARERARDLQDHAVDLATQLTGGARRTLGDDLRAVVSLLEGGVVHAALVDSGQLWDTHADAFRQHGSWDSLFRALTGLGEGLETRGMLDDTLVVVLSELGRTPWRNPHRGTDHWPYTSAVLFGADVAGGASLGGTDDGFVGLTCDPRTGRPSGAAADPLRVTNLTAGVLEAVGLPGALPGVEPLRGFR
jgi:uncharacterized protein (DUF1501 family)